MSKGHGNETGFPWVFAEIGSSVMSPLHYLSGRSDFGFEFAEIFVFEKRLPAITDTGSRRLSHFAQKLARDVMYYHYRII